MHRSDTWDIVHASIYRERAWAHGLRGFSKSVVAFIGACVCRMPVETNHDGIHLLTIRRLKRDANKNKTGREVIHAVITDLPWIAFYPTISF